MNAKRFEFSVAVLFLAMTVVITAAPPEAFGATLTVTNLASIGPGSLRQALSDNLNLGGGNTIVFSSNVTGTITLQGELSVNAPVIIRGPGADVLAVSGNNFVRIFTVTAGPTVISDLTVRNGRVAAAAANQMHDGDDAVAGGIYNLNSTLILSNCVVHSNSVAGGTGGDRAQGTVGRGGKGFGGGVYNEGGTLVLMGTRFEGNQAVGGRGGFGMSNAAGPGGDAQGGAVCSLSGSNHITGCSAVNNRAEGGTGGGISGGNQPGHGGNGYGGGLYTVNTVLMANSTIRGCNASGGGTGDGTATAPGTGYGGGIYNISSLSLYSSTIVSNSASGFGSTDWGGGIFNGSDMGITNSTIAFNQADSGGGLYGSVTAANSIFAGNVAAIGPDASAAITSLDYNLIQNTNGTTITSATTHNLTGQNPLLGPLQNNGGPTLTMALLPGSPAIDQGKSFGLTADQRGAPRPFDFTGTANAPGGDGCDIGAFESLPAPQLNIQRVDNNNVILFWSADAADFRLESVTNLPPANNWSNVNNARVTIANQVYVTNSAAGASKFYRLSFP